MLNIVKFILFICLLWPLQAVSNDAACIAVTLTKEAATEGLLGKRAVFDTIITRMKESGKTACQVIMQPNQFSWTKGIGTFPSPSKKELTTYSKVVNMKPVVRATHFHLTSVHPKWVRKMKFVKKIGKHLFYLER